MKTHYTCGTCKKILESSEDNFYPSSLKKVAKDQNRLVIPKCKPCSSEYAKQWRHNIKNKGLTRSQKNTSIMAGAVTGTVYVIGPDLPETPFKIGITVGKDTSKRKTALQTAHWMELKLMWKSPVLDRADIIEKKLHNHFKKKHERGEWYNITRQDIAEIPNLVNIFNLENK